ncbi:hypothetical protein E1292_17325 [Nonomuraea deserti]|uniref:Uncharacterized protein n=1 Tax=Nonomuraea deserti TaxID=1848322 RepID=A0A4R4VQ39_9ACTN|nr:hypothetical protein [Nonomuraea deserti]TDD05233.1 hypothetical protein E1292_17325 [Nonomuraea deserti]
MIDALVLGAFRYHPRRIETEEGFEATFALYVRSRWVLAVALRTSLERARRPVIVNLCGTGTGRIHWDDLQLTTRYRPLTAIMQGARASALLGAAYASERTRYVLYNPVFVATGLRQPVRGIVRAASALFAQSAAEAVPPLAALIDDPPAGRLTAYKKGDPIRLDPGEARRFEEIVRSMAGHARRAGQRRGAVSDARWMSAVDRRTAGACRDVPAVRRFGSAGPATLLAACAALAASAATGWRRPAAGSALRLASLPL